MVKMTDIDNARAGCFYSMYENNTYIGLDFDHTCVRSEKYPDYYENPHCAVVLRKLQKKGYKLILITMREGKFLDDALEWFKKHGIELYGINDNPDQHTWTTARKVFVNWFIDDRNLGTPMVYPKNRKEYVDWYEVEKWFIKQGLL